MKLLSRTVSNCRDLSVDVQTVIERVNDGLF